jgi:tetratricopeptide (TPR) repeat protein
VTASIIVQGRHHWHQRTRTSVERAIAYFSRAIERDPRAVDAWYGLADSWILMGGRGYTAVEVASQHAARSVERALGLDDALSFVHTSIGGLNILRRRWRDAESALRNAIRLDPRNADARHWLALTLLSGFGDLDGAIREQTITVRLNPLAAVQVGTLGWQRYLRGEHELSRSHMEPAVDLNADFEEGHAGLARAAARLGDEATVMTTIAAGLTRRADLRGDLLAEQASAVAVLGNRRRARRLACEAMAHRATPINVALAWASMGDADCAFESLARESFLVYWVPQAVWWDPRFDGIRDDRRFADVRKRVAQTWVPEWP